VDGVRDAQHGLQSVQILLVLDHEELDQLGEGVVRYLSRLRVDHDLQLPLIEQLLRLRHRLDQLIRQVGGHWHAIEVGAARIRVGRATSHVEA